MERAVERGFKCLGLTGTRWLVDSEVYPEQIRRRGLAYLRPGETERDEINRIIIEELVYGEFKPVLHDQCLAQQYAARSRCLRLLYPPQKWEL